MPGEFVGTEAARWMDTRQESVMNKDGSALEGGPAPCKGMDPVLTFDLRPCDIW